MDDIDKITQKICDTEESNSHPANNENFLKSNGDNAVLHQVFHIHEDSCSSSSTSSSQNLIIDQQDASSRGNDSDINKDTELDKNTLKRKLVCENGSKGNKRLHVDNNMPKSLLKSNSCEEITNFENVKNTENIKELWKKRKQYTDFREVFKGMELQGNEKEGHFQEYAQYLGLKPNVKYKCYKCFNASFENLSQLRDHQKVCLFNNSRNCDLNTNEIPHSSNNNKLFDTKLVLGVNSQINENLNSKVDSNASIKCRRKVFLCSACGTYYENWNLFLHMREVHKRHICLYCVGMFPSAERLTVHLEMKHDLEQNHFDCQEKLLRSSRDTCYLMCCICEHLFTEHEDFSDHACAELIQPCPLCGQKGRHSPNCKASTSQSNRMAKKERIKRKNKTNRVLSNTTNIENGIEPSLNLANSYINNDSNIYPELQGNDFLCNQNVQGVYSKLNGLNTNKEEITTKPLSEDLDIKQPPDDKCSKIAIHSILNTEISSQSIETLDKRLEYNDCATLENRNNISSPINDKINNTNVTEKEKSVDETNSSIECSTLSSHNNNISEDFSDGGVHQPSLDKYVTENATDPVFSDHTEENHSEQKRLLVPKFKIKVPKEYQTPIESEQSSTESGSDDELDKSGIMDDQSDVEMKKNQSDDEMRKDLSDEEVKKDLSDEEIRKEQSNEEMRKDQSDYETKKDESPEDVKEAISEDKIKENQLEDNEKSIAVDNEEKFVFPGNEENNKVDIKNKGETNEVLENTSNVECKDVLMAPADGIEVANDDVQLIELSLDKPLDRISVIDFLRICLRRTFLFCLYCNHARRIAVNGHSLTLHFISQHRFSATVDSITAEELKPSTILSKLKSFLPDLEETSFNLDTYNNFDKNNIENIIPCEKIFECFQCRFETRIHKELYLHNRKMHLKTAILCFMCRSNFFSYSEILCHVCPGIPNKCTIFDIHFRCCLCALDKIPSAFRLMVHLRKKHFACDVCLEDCHDQSKLSNHVWKHKLHHLCYRCGIAYRNKPDITKHLFWKHGTESILCKRCLQKRWPHVYHFCIPPLLFICEVCNLTFSRAMSLKVHKRLHTGDAPYPCIEDNCDKKFISRKLLLKHVARHTEENEIKNNVMDENQSNEKIESKPENELEKNVEENETHVPKEIETSKRKRKKTKKDARENLDDLMNLPAPNLSESDSSDSESEKNKAEIFNPLVPTVMLSPASDIAVDDDEANAGPIMDIWENFKTFQASQTKVVDDDLKENDVIPLPPIMHVSQSDHDYCMMFKPITKTSKSTTKDEKIEGMSEDKKEVDVSKEDIVIASSKKKQKSPKKTDKSGSETSSSGSSSSSDSSCSCGSNCSCSSSSGSSSDSSSSSDDSDSSTSEGKRRIAAKRAAKQEKRNKIKAENSPKANVSDIVDVVTTDTKAQDVNPDSIILESDLETDESETDEDFYDDHPQKLASQLLAEKRKQLMLQTSLSPSHNYDIVENSRPSTPSLPEEIIKEKKVKIKKKKRDRKGSKNSTIPSFKLNIPNINQMITTPAQLPDEIFSQPETPPIQPMISPLFVQETPIKIPAPIQAMINAHPMSMPAPISTKNRLSTGSSSDADAPLKRSKRRRRPNKFYGYSSDDDMASTLTLSGSAAFKPTPPPNLTWRKEDLPTPSRSSSGHKHNRTSTSSSKKVAVNNTQLLPPIPTIIIRPSGKKSPVPDRILQKPPFVEPTRVPPVPVHHITPQLQFIPTPRESNESESSDDDDKLHISTLPSKILQKQLPPPVAVAAISKPVQNQPRIPPALLPNPDLARLQYFQRNNIRYPIQPPAGARPPREGESVYCYCRCPYDEVSEMIACDGEDCVIEWFHFECVGIMVPPKGKWFCPECRTSYPNEFMNSYDNT